LTELGTKLLDNPTHSNLVDALEQSIVGVSEILEAIEKGPLTEKEICIYLNESLSLGWKTSAQPRFRLTWLQNAKAIEKQENGTFKVLKT